MSQVVVVATARARKGSEQAARDAFAALAEQTHAEAGCLAYALHEDPDDPQALVVVERWTSSVALENHFHQPYVKALPELAADLLEGTVEIRRLVPVPTGDPTKGTL
jgi:quinol monooxygenase YgiN